MIEKVQESHLYMWLKEKDSKFLSKLDETIEYANTILPQINNVFASYTVHGVRHSINVMEYMYALVVDINKLSELEVALLIYSALLHDIGMIANVDEIKEIKADHAILGERKYSKVLEKYGDEMTALQECVRPVHGNKSIKKRKDGSNYKDFYYYGCKHRNMTRGHKCDYKKQVHEEMLDASVAEVISKLVSNPKFSDLIRNKINMEVDTSALDQEIENYKIQLRKLYHNKDTILSDMDSLDYEDKHYQRRKTDLENHLYKTYDKIDDEEELLVSAKAKKRSLLADKITGDNIYKALVLFDKLYAQMNEAEKREFLSQLVDNVQIYEERKENGQWLKSIEFKLPIIEKEFTLSLDNDTQNETVCLLSRKVG